MGNAGGEAGVSFGPVHSTLFPRRCDGGADYSLSKGPAQTPYV